MNAYTLDELTGLSGSFSNQGEAGASVSPPSPQKSSQKFVRQPSRSYCSYNDTLLREGIAQMKGLFEQSVTLFSSLAATLDVSVTHKPTAQDIAKSQALQDAVRQAEEMQAKQLALQQTMYTYGQRIQRLRGVIGQLEKSGRTANIADIQTCADGLSAIVNAMSQATNARPDIFSTAPKH
jgi:hypothetical protein